MHLSFLNPLWLLGALVAVPLLAHLFSRARPNKRLFPSLRLLREAMRHVTRIRRPRDRWLLVLRTLAMLALILSFLQPWLLSRFASPNGTTKTVLLVVDLTASMAYADGTRTRLAQATAAAEELLATLPSNSRANIVWVQAHANSVLPEPGPNLDFLRQSLRAAGARSEPADISGAMDLALKQLQNSEGDRELVVLSDFQKSDWRTARWDLPEGIRLTRITTGPEDAANLGIAGLTLEPARAIAGQEARLSCRIRNFSNEPQRITVFLEAGESRLSQTVDVTPWSETLALVPVKFPREGLFQLKATLPADRFPGDDVRFGLAEVRGSLQVTVAGKADDATAQVWARAAQALDGVTVQRVTFEQLENATPPDILLVAGWSGQALQAIRSQIKRSGALALQPAPGLDSATIQSGLGLAPSTDLPLSLQVQDAPGWRLRIANEDHPLFALFASGLFGDPVAGRFRRRLSSPQFAESKPLVAYEDGQLALSLLESAESAPIAWWNLDLGATDWPNQTAFLPFFGEFLRQLSIIPITPIDPKNPSGETPLPRRNPRNFEPGEPIAFEAGSVVDPADIRLVDEQEKPLKIIHNSQSAPGRIVSALPPAPGSYRWFAQANLLDRAVINFPESESDLRQLRKDDLEQGIATGVSDAGSNKLMDLREGKPLWAWCLAAAALFLLLEGLCLWLPKKNPAVGKELNA